MSIARNTTSGNELALDELRILRERMQTAFEAGQWQDLADLDNDCRLLVGRIMNTANVSVFDELTATLRFYAELLENCRKSKTQLAEQSIALRQSQARGRVYRSMNIVR